MELASQTDFSPQKKIKNNFLKKFVEKHVWKTNPLVTLYPTDRTPKRMKEKKSDGGRGRCGGGKREIRKWKKMFLI